MKRNDAIFGELEYDDIWRRYMEVVFFGKKAKIVLIVDSDDDDEFEEGQYIAYTSLLEKWDSIQESIVDNILDYYTKKREELGYDIQKNENYPHIKTREELLKHITLTGISVQFAEIYGGRSIGLGFDCTWNEEDGIGVRLVNEEVNKVGYQDVSI